MTRVQKKRRIAEFGQTVGTFVLFVAVILCLYALDRHSSRLPGCGVTEIWSHRGYLDQRLRQYGNATTSTTCGATIRELHRDGVNNYDVDVMTIAIRDHRRRRNDDEDDDNNPHDEVQTVVAHPSDFHRSSPSWNPAPCSGTPLKDFLRLLRHTYGTKSSSPYMVTMEPKASWDEEDERQREFSSPQVVLLNMLQVLEELRDDESNNSAYDLRSHCGIILSTAQLEDVQIVPLRSRIERICRLALPLPRDQAPLLDKIPGHPSSSSSSPSTSFSSSKSTSSYSILMPTIELMGGPNGKAFVRKATSSSSTLRTRPQEETRTSQYKVVVWVVDTLQSLKLALRLPAHGIITNHPKQLQQYYQQLCS